MALTVLSLILSMCAMQWVSCELSIDLNTVEDLASQYYNIFKTGNRNAASHLWSKFILDRADSMSPGKLESIFHGFCAVSGSPLPDLQRTEYHGVSLPKVGGGYVTGTTRHCCWPCVCDATELVRVDTKTINTAHGPKAFDFLVIGDPCLHEEQIKVPFGDPFTGRQSTLAAAAPEVKCENGKLVNAIFSDHGHPIIGMLFNTQPEQVLPIDPTSGFGQQCAARKEHGYDSGMGKIFHVVAKITPIPVGEASEGITQMFSVEPKIGAGGDAKAGPPYIVFSSLAVVTVAMMAVMWHLRNRADRSMRPNEHSSYEMQSLE